MATLVSKEKRCAYATLLTNDGFSAGAEALIYSLTKFNPTVPLLLLHTEQVHSSVIQRICKIAEIKAVTPGKFRIIPRCVKTIPMPQYKTTLLPAILTREQVKKHKESTSHVVSSSIQNEGCAPACQNYQTKVSTSLSGIAGSTSELRDFVENCVQVEGKQCSLAAEESTGQLTHNKDNGPLNEQHKVMLNELSCKETSSNKSPSWQSAEFTKLRVWQQTDYDKILYIDADCIILDTIEELFELEDLPAFAPDVFPPDCFNAGVIVLRPDQAIFSDMMDKLNVYPSHDGGDTGFLNSYYRNWYSWSSKRRLPFRYNALRTMYWFTHHRPGYWQSVQPLKILHYCSSPKPWENGDPRGDLELHWWILFLEYSSNKE